MIEEPYHPISRIYQPYDPLQDDPNIEVWVRTTRKLDKNGNIYSQWDMAYSVNGIPNGELSQLQKDYLAAIFNQLSDWLAVPSRPDIPYEKAIAWAARKTKARLQAAMDEYQRLSTALINAIGFKRATFELGEADTVKTQYHGKVPLLRPFDNRNGSAIKTAIQTLRSRNGNALQIG